MIHPTIKNLVAVFLSGEITGPDGKRCIKPKLPINSAVPNTAGITVVKLRVAQKLYSSEVKCSAPRYTQFWRRWLIASNNHQEGADTAKSPLYFFQFRVSREVLLRKNTRASTVRQYPSHIGKKPQCVRSPSSFQFRNQKAAISSIPIQPCSGNFGWLFELLLFFITQTMISGYLPL